MLGKKTKELLNDQVEAEAFASQSYLAMHVYLDDAGYDGFAKFFFDHSEEERLHMMKVIGYLSDKNEKTEVRPIKDVKTKFDSVLDVFNHALELEYATTDSIKKVCAEATKDNDFMTLNFLNWFLEEQREEEALFNTFFFKIEIFGDNKAGLYLLQEELKNYQPQNV
jgi:ferritin